MNSVVRAKFCESVAMAEFDTQNGLNPYVKQMIEFLQRRSIGRHGRYLETLRTK